MWSLLFLILCFSEMFRIFWEISYFVISVHFIYPTFRILSAFLYRIFYTAFRPMYASRFIRYHDGIWYDLRCRMCCTARRQWFDNIWSSPPLSVERPPREVAGRPKPMLRTLLPFDHPWSSIKLRQNCFILFNGSF